MKAKIMHNNEEFTRRINETKALEVFELKIFPRVYLLNTHAKFIARWKAEIDETKTNLGIALSFELPTVFAIPGKNKPLCRDMKFFEKRNWYAGELASKVYDIRHKNSGITTRLVMANTEENLVSISHYLRDRGYTIHTPDAHLNHVYGREKHSYIQLEMFDDSDVQIHPFFTGIELRECTSYTIRRLTLSSLSDRFPKIESGEKTEQELVKQELTAALRTIYTSGCLTKTEIKEICDAAVK